MNEIDFKLYLAKQGFSKKVASDLVSRLKRIEKEFNVQEIDSEYERDKCAYILNLFNKKGLNDDMQTFCTSLPVGSYQLSTFKYALNNYIKFLDNFYNKALIKSDSSSPL
ncbi:MAG: hypothetical protein E7369_04335 [Clostridiales bacterium]|nr:hypothetical protein [Clostridiales bacterium]